MENTTNIKNQDGNVEETLKVDSTKEIILKEEDNKHDKFFDPDFNSTSINPTLKIDYMKLVHKFGTELIKEDLLERFQRLTGKDLHPWLKRGIFFTHREFDKFLDAYEAGEPVFLYTGRGPSSDAM